MVDECIHHHEGCQDRCGLLPNYFGHCCNLIAVTSQFFHYVVFRISYHNMLIALHDLWCAVMHQVQIFTRDGAFVRKFGATVLQHPRGVTVDFRGRIVVVECKVSVTSVHYWQFCLSHASSMQANYRSYNECGAMQLGSCFKCCDNPAPRITRVASAAKNHLRNGSGHIQVPTHHTVGHPPPSCTDLQPHVELCHLALLCHFSLIIQHLLLGNLLHGTMLRGRYCNQGFVTCPLYVADVDNNDVTCTATASEITTLRRDRNVRIVITVIIIIIAVVWRNLWYGDGTGNADVENSLSSPYSKANALVSRDVTKVAFAIRIWRR